MPENNSPRTSARSLLLTALGEFVLPNGPAWTSALVHLLGTLGVEEKAARQALSRTAADGWLTGERDGRRVRWSLTARGRRLLSEGAERIYALGTGRSSWDGRWLVLTVTVPESQRSLRHRLQTKLTWAGLGNPAQGLWVTPHAGREAEVKEVVAELGLDGSAFSFTGPFAGVGEEAVLVRRAWDLEAVARQYEAFLAAFAGVRPGGGDALLAAQTRLVHEWRRYPFLDPQLPDELLPPQWTGRTASARFHELHDRWSDRAQRRWAELNDQGNGS
ncbi:PaaX family transcriptional regulator C-terminal domain-containing protein [Streptomyces boninensis]|uniref:PaaX family transcriptional regulator n=1 Tax=Streptomyces boninensis TaxID=2039455 RepID=UPI003B20C551